MSSSDLAVTPEAAQRHVVTPVPGGMTVDRFVGDVEPEPAGESVESVARLVPGELGAGPLVVDEVGLDRPCGRVA